MYASYERAPCAAKDLLQAAGCAWPTLAGLMRLAEHDTGKAKLTAFLKHYVYVCMYEQTEAARASTLNRRRHLPSKAQGQTLVNYVFEQHARHLFIHASFPCSPHLGYKINKQGKLEN